MPKTGAREGKELVGCTINTIATMLKPMYGSKLIFNGLGDWRGSKCVPDSRALQRHPWGDNEHLRPVFVTKVVNQVPGILFCNFRDVRPEDVCASTEIAEATPFSEEICFVRVEDGALVVTYQAAIADTVWHDEEPKSNPFEIRVVPGCDKVQIERRRWLDSKDGESNYRRGWFFATNRERFPALGGKDCYPFPNCFTETFCVYSEADFDAMVALFGDHECDD